ncbi:MAG: hypothetical protein OEM05_13225 [Myxococcales bacterium]|nr:hypothetical protein [Myxococcales bacterium]
MTLSPTTPRPQSLPPREGGFALLLTVLLLLLLALLGFAALDAVSKDQQVAGFQNQRAIAFFAAEAGVAKAMETLTTVGTPSVPTTTLGDGTIFPFGQPSFRVDPTVTDPIDGLGVASYPGMGLNIGQGGTPVYQLNYWRIRVQGDGPGGSVARLDTVSGVLAAN